MSDDSDQQEAPLTVSNSSSLSSTPSRLVQRGLSALERPAVTSEQIQTARNTIREYRGLKDETVRIALKRASCWEYLLFFQVLTDEIAGYESLRQAVGLGIAPNSNEKLEFSETMSWFQRRLDDIQGILDRVKTVFKKDFPLAIGPPGKPGDPVAIVLTARKMGLIYKHMLDLSIRLAIAQKDSIFDGILRELGKEVDGLADDLNVYVSSSLSIIKEVIAAPKTDERREIKLTWIPSLNHSTLTIEQAKLNTILDKRR